jgi:hypothetical protein
MPKLASQFLSIVTVPSWKYCNEQREDNSVATFNCKFEKGEYGNRYCLLFEESLYSSSKFILKCDRCLKLSVVGD